MASRLRFLTLDVFTDRVFTGNRLAVLPDARDAAGRALAEATMQAIAREFGFSETTFVLPSRRDDCVRRVRIFTPEAELPFAGHPTVGTALALVNDGVVPLPTDEIGFAFDLDAGPTPVHVRRGQDGLEAEFTAPQAPRIGQTTAPAVVAAALGLSLADLDTSAHLPTDAGTGLGFVMVRLVDLRALGAAAPDRASLRRLPSPAARHGVVCYVPMDEAAGHLRVRVFVPEMGIDEDPATGSAAAGLAGLLAGLAPAPDGTRCFRLEQGVEMGRPSLIRAEADVRVGTVAAVRIAGRAVTVSDGWLHLPA
jgi:trans-2,3-dihydro-3-hydroxyanthranilate isomerase